ncbi:MAG: hypothetical protein HY303_21965 [Candidatus Wallbacteria bacterium]|nr:hypothetical protein [Candidatus Wallbacteria bacterium]
MGCCSGSVSFAKLVGPSRRGPLLSVLVAGLLLATQAPAQPNFRIGAIFLPAEAAVGDTFRPNVEVRNTGNANTTLYWSTGLLLLDPGATALPASPQFPGSADTGNNGSVPAGETRTWVGFVPTRGMALGSYKLGARADNANGIVELDETDNDAVSAGTIRLVTPTADLIVDRFQSPSRASRGDAIPMTATLKNIGTGPARFPSDCGFYISTDTTITREDRGLSGGGTYPGLPPGQTARLESCCVVIPADLAPGQYYVGAVADLYDAVGETNKANNGSPQPVALTVTSPGADLIVTTVQASAAAARIGDPIEVTATIKNQGAVSTPRGFSAIVALAQGRQATTTDPVVKYELVSALESGATSQVVFAGGSIPRNLAPGPYKLTVVADASFSIGESDETNNAFSVDFTVQPASADLRVDSVNAGPAAFRSTLFSAGAVVSNRGTGPAGAFLVTGYLSSDVTVTTQDQAMGESYEGGLAASTTAAITLSAIVPASLAPGSYTYGVIVDSRDDVVETNESNNVRAASGTVLLSQATADLTIESVQMPASVSAGDLFVATATVRNRGTGDVTTPFRVELLVSADVTLTVADTGIGRFDVASLAAGAAVTETFYAKVPRSIAPGTYTAGALADFDATVGETDETNNARAASGRFAISAPAADLVIDQFVFPASASVSSAFPATAVVRNRGSGNVVPDFNVGFVLSTDTTFTGADLILRGTTVRGLAAGQTFRAQESLTVPGAVAPGNYFAFAVADLYDDAGEIDETNNVSSRPFVVTPPPNVDLSVTAVRHDAARVSVGDSFPVTLTVHNAGPGATAAPFDLSVVLALRRQNGSPDPVVRSEVGRAPVALLAAGENRTLSFFVASNGALAPATYVMLGVADPENQIAETD